MAKDSWPNGVTSWDDTVKFTQLVFGTDVNYEDYGERLPHPSKKSFLLFAKGACAEGRDLHEIGSLIEPHMAAIKDTEMRLRNNYGRPDKSQLVLGKGVVYYKSTQLTRAPCTCRTVFGADKHMGHVQTCSSMWAAGDRLAELWDATLLKNFKMFKDSKQRPIWLDKSWQAVWNWNDHNQGHGIHLHQDICDTYSSSDPITSFSFGRGGVLTLSSSQSQQASKMLFQEHGDVLVMAGEFQSEFWHGVPARSSWKDLVARSMFAEMQAWEQRGLEEEIQMHETAVDGVQHVRMNCTMRWHTTHWPGCPNHVENVSRTQPVFTGAVRTAERGAAREVASGSTVSEPPASSDVSFTRVKRSSSDAEICPSENSFKSSRSLDVASAEAMRILLELVDISSHANAFRRAIVGVPLVGWRPHEKQVLLDIENEVLQWRGKLLQASEAVAECGEKYLESVDYKALDALALAAQQRRIIQNHLGAFRTQSHGDWLIATNICAQQNRLNKEGLYHKCLVTHQQLEVMLEALSATEMKECKEIAIDLRQLAPGSFPVELPCLKRQDKRRQMQDQGMDTYKVSAESVLLVKALEIGYVSRIEEGKRLLSHQSVWEDLLKEVPLCDIIFSLKTGIRTALEHLRTLDVERNFCDRPDANPVGAKYDIWIWLWRVQEQKSAAAKGTTKASRRNG